MGSGWSGTNYTDFFGASVWASTNKRPAHDTPTVIKRGTPIEWSKSGNVPAQGSPNTVAASSKPTPCFWRLVSAFVGFQMNLKKLSSNEN
jgi:hypothetical protein